jgi:hypothetical protein
MTTIYEIYENKVKEFDERHPTVRCVTPAYAFESDTVSIKQKDAQLFLRQSFIAMVEGEIEELRKVQGEWDFEVGGFIEYQISRLESELLKLKEN